MLITIFRSRATASLFFRPNFSCRAGSISPLYLSYKRGQTWTRAPVLRGLARRLALARQPEIAAADRAVREAIASGIVSKTHILNRLSHLLDTPPPAALEPPPALSLIDEPVANTERYDNLRENDHVG